jgi:hypothetical protein
MFLSDAVVDYDTVPGLQTSPYMKKAIIVLLASTGGLL